MFVAGIFFKKNKVLQNLEDYKIMLRVHDKYNRLCKARDNTLAFIFINPILRRYVCLKVAVKVVLLLLVLKWCQLTGATGVMRLRERYGMVVQNAGVVRIAPDVRIVRKRIRGMLGKISSFLLLVD